MICDHCENETPTASLPYKPFKTKYSSCGTIDLCEECLRKMLAQLTKRAADGALPEFCRECMDEFGHPDNCIGCPNRPAANANRSAASWLSEER